MPDKQSETLITIQVTPNELIALGHLIFAYRLRLENMPSPSEGQRELLKLLESFQQRVAAPTREALDLAATPQPWEKNNASSRFASSVAHTGNHVWGWIDRSFHQVVDRLSKEPSHSSKGTN